MVVPDAQFTQEPFLPGTPEELMSNGQFNTGCSISQNESFRIFFTKMNYTKISSFYWKHFKIEIPKTFYFPWKGFEHYSPEHFLQISRSLAELIKRQKILTYNKLYRN